MKGQPEVKGGGPGTMGRAAALNPRTPIDPELTRTSDARHLTPATAQPKGPPGLPPDSPSTRSS
ncbi:hypothetical protein [Kitasatospora sp. NPDC088351]|uniref:hypothetical protein n=1 Tax=Kitasatospora sp. NPDC088351 TaxID=3155180 RepID=UPI0034156B62